MLTPIDVHYLVGLLCMVSNPDSVDIELGNYLDDVAAEAERDIDITITHRAEDGSSVGYIGIEVKAHSRPLDVGHIDGLCQKFKDIKAISRGGIVSASGYTTNAIKKAKYHGVDLYNLESVQDRNVTVNNVTFPPNSEAFETISEWVGKPLVEFRCASTGGQLSQFTSQSLVKLGTGADIPNCRTLDDLANRTAQLAVRKIEAQFAEPESVGTSVDQPFSVNVILADQPCVLVEDQLLPLIEATVTGVIRKTKFEMVSELKTLTKEGDPDFSIACLISEAQNGILLGVTASHFDDLVWIVTVPVSDRLKNKIYRQPIRRSSNQALP